MKKLLTGLFFIASGVLSAQDTITLDYCYQQAIRNYPLGAGVPLYGQSSDLKLKNLGKNFLPTVNLNASASYQSAVTEVSIDLPSGFPPISVTDLSKDWYKFTLDLKQSIYDGNVTSYQKRTEKYNLEVETKNVEIELYKIRDRVNQFYYTILLMQETEAILVDSRDRLQLKVKELQSGVNNGTVLVSSVDLIKAEIIKTNQQIIEAKADRVAAIKMLSELMSVTLPEGALYKLPDMTISTGIFEDKRPEYQLFDIQSSRVSLLKNMVTTKWNPKIFAFGQAGLGRPALNMLSNDFEPFYVVGLQFTWNPWNWNQNKNEKKILEIQKSIIKTQQETFDKNIRVNVQRDLADVQKAADLLVGDEEIISLREKITKSASVQLDNGVITSSDYLIRVNEEKQALLTREIHRIQLSKAKVSYLFTTGKL
jgi:outer membrane protein TolC